MKNTLTLVLLLTLAVSATAQHDVLPYYIGMPQFYMDHSLYGALDDTVYGDVLCHTTLWPANHVAGVGFGNNTEIYRNIINGDLAIGFYPDSTLHVIGIAVPLCFSIGSLDVTNNNEISDKLEQLYTVINNYNYYNPKFVFSLYQPYENHMSLLTSITIDSTFDTANCRMYKLYDGINNSFYNDSNNVSGNCGCLMLEAYFDNEVDLADSFYVSFNLVYRDTISRNITPTWIDKSYGYWSGTSRFPVQSFRAIKNMTSEDDTWTYIEYPYYPLIWPLIRRDCDTCPTVQGLQYVKSSPTKAFFRWQRGEGHRDWQLSYGPAGTAPEDGTIIDYKQAQSGLIEFDPDSHYVAYVRARCRFARFEYGPWSAPLHFCLNGNGLEEASATELTLSPNPAADMVTVGCSAGMTQITVFNAAGVQVHTEAMGGGTSATIDTKGWPAGQYVVSVETAAGTASKVLTVAR